MPDQLGSPQIDPMGLQGGLPPLPPPMPMQAPPPLSGLGPSGGIAGGMGSAIAGIGTAAAGQQSPFPGQHLAAQHQAGQQQYQQAQMQDMAIRRRLEYAGLEERVKDRRLQQDANARLMYHEMIASDVPEGVDAGLRGIMGLAKSQGLQTPNLDGALLRKRLKFTDLKEIAGMVAGGATPDGVRRAFPNVDPATLQEFMANKDKPGFRRTYGIKTLEEEALEVRKAKAEGFDLMRKENPEVAGNSRTAELAWGIARDKYNAYYGDLAKEQKADVRALAASQYLKEERDKLVQAGKIRQDEKTKFAPAGGTWRNAATGEEQAGINESLGTDPNWFQLSAKQVTDRAYANRAIPTFTGMKQIIHGLLATEPLQNIVQAITNKGMNMAGASADLRKLHTFAFDGSIEQARALGGGVVRTKLLELVQQHAGIADSDTVDTATAVLDADIIQLQNVVNGINKKPLIDVNSIVGPARVVVVPDGGGPKVVKTIPPGMITNLPGFKVIKRL